MSADLVRVRVHIGLALSVTRVYSLPHAVFLSIATLHLSNVETKAWGIK